MALKETLSLALTSNNKHDRLLALELVKTLDAKELLIIEADLKKTKIFCFKLFPQSIFPDYADGINLVFERGDKLRKKTFENFYDEEIDNI